MLFPILILVFVIFFILNQLKEKNIQTISINKSIRPKEKNSLIKLLNDISSGDKVILKDIVEKWSLTKNTIDEELKSKISSLIKEVLLKIKEITDYSFYVNSIENIYVMKDNEGNFRCILNCFIYEIKKYYTIKLVMDIVYYEDEIYFNFIDIDESSINNIVDRYDIRWDGAGILSNYDMFDENTEHILNNYYNSNYNIIYLENKDINIDKTTLFTMKQFKNDYLPLNSPKDKKSPYFCEKNKNTWDLKGIKQKTYRECLSHDNSYQGVSNTPIQGPGVVTNNPDDNQHKWLFSKSMGPLKSSAQY